MASNSSSEEDCHFRSSNLLWDQNESRVMFGQLQLWPSFVGTSIMNERHEAGRLPVLIWPEQAK
jgi:hypothetical protein